jgi:hypothetical protein
MPSNEVDEFDGEWKEFTDDEIECYRLWFEFLKLSDKTKWTEEVLDYFGDVSRCSFEDWWPDHKYLFNKNKVYLERITSEEHYRNCKDDGSDPNGPYVLALFVGLWETKKDLREAFEKMLTKYHKGKAGRPEFHGDGDYYNLHQHPDTEMLTKILNVYQEYLSDPEEDRRALWEIEEKCSLIDRGAAVLWKIKDNEESRRKSQHSTVRRYIDYAEEILKNVVKGKFPVYTVKKVKDEGTAPAA